MLIATVVTGLVLPIRGVAADVLKQITFWAVALLFFLYGAKFDAAAIRSGMLNWRLQGLTFAATYLLFAPPRAGPHVRPRQCAGPRHDGGQRAGSDLCSVLFNLIGVALTPALVAVFLHQGGSAISGAAVVKIAL